MRLRLTPKILVPSYKPRSYGPSLSWSQGFLSDLHPAGTGCKYFICSRPDLLPTASQTSTEVVIEWCTSNDEILLSTSSRKIPPRSDHGCNFCEWFPLLYQVIEILLSITPSFVFCTAPKTSFFRYKSILIALKTARFSSGIQRPGSTSLTSRLLSQRAT